MPEVTTSRAEAYVSDLSRRLRSLDVAGLEAAATLVEEKIRAGHSIFIAGNGGSSAVAEHMASDWRAAAAEAGCRTGEILSLTSNVAVLTALANDCSYDEVFSRQIVERATAGDLLVCLSVSGGSVNVLRAAAEARGRGVAVLGLVGRESALAQVSDMVIFLDVDGDYGIAEDMQSVFMHLVARVVRRVDHHRVPQQTGWIPE